MELVLEGVRVCEEVPAREALRGGWECVADDDELEASSARGIVVERETVW
jgi:hypothetical protein